MKKCKPSVSVIIPAYNEEKHLEECLVSLKSQTYPNLELLIIDDGSTDSSPKIAKKYADIFLTQRHQGPGVARNKAANVAKGEILLFVDADMYLDKNYVKEIIRPILNRKAIATFTKNEFVANKDNIWSKCLQIDNNLPNNLRISRSVKKVSIVFRAIQKDIFLKRNGYKVTLGYRDDQFFTINDKQKAIVAKGAICYHYNPDTLKDVYLSARWQGRSKEINLNSLLKYSVVFSVVRSLNMISEGAPIKFLFYKIIFDLGILTGIVSKNSAINYSK